MKKQNKTIRWNLRIPPELNDRATKIAAQLGKSRNSLIEHAVWSFLLDTKNFAICPTCAAYCFIIEEMPIYEGISEVVCPNRHSHWYDFDEEQWVR